MRQPCKGITATWNPPLQPSHTTSRNTVIIRGFADGTKRFEEHISPEDIEQNMEAIIESHAERLAAEHLHMIEMEFTGLPESERFFRFGTDPRNMVAPIGVTQAAKPAACSYCHGSGQLCENCVSPAQLCCCTDKSGLQVCGGCQGDGEA